ncbi:hypothetical protein EVG20_g9934 [Dentipellis fragilis]|uniref:Uncharacterized protein n=1 Tax=Dentipellis fragilis TaxID=205917 RepID=A0A4Y9XZ55_9AGAM|nr:hypothetical protein EVG20_g9934 [Dentipellis fragilis]
MLAVEWDAQDAARRRHKPKASTIHGWLCKMRGTLMGNESVRREGRYEMKEARAIRTYMKQRSKQQKKQAGGFSLFGLGGGSSRPRSRGSSRRHAVSLSRGSRHSGSQKKSSTALVPYAQRGQAKRQQSDRRRLLQAGGQEGEQWKQTPCEARAPAAPQPDAATTAGEATVGEEMIVALRVDGCTSVYFTTAYDNRRAFPCTLQHRPQDVVAEDMSGTYESRQISVSLVELYITWRHSRNPRGTAANGTLGSCVTTTTGSSVPYTEAASIDQANSDEEAAALLLGLRALCASVRSGNGSRNSRRCSSLETTEVHTASGPHLRLLDTP